jgi:hypothetical protein
MAELRARTIVEAHIYLDLLRSAGVLGASDPGDPDGWTRLTEGTIGWTLHADGADGAFRPFDIVIPYGDFAEARRTGVRFGSRASTLIDAWQWREVAQAYAEQAIEAGLTAAGSPGDQRLLDVALQAWRFAVDTAGEALRFLPAGADRLPRAAFWTRDGLRAYQSDPHQFSRAELQRQVDIYRQLSDDFAEMMVGR